MKRQGVASILVVAVFLAPNALGYSGGSGTPEDPFQIATAQDLIHLRETVEDYDKHFVLSADIDLSGHVFDRAVIAPDLNDEYSGHQGSEFSGFFDGKDRIIQHLSIKGNDYLGLFGWCTAGAVVMNLGLENVMIEGEGATVGGLIGANWGGAVVNSYSTGMVSGTGSVGGLVGGSREGVVSNSYSTCTVNGLISVGGLVGFNTRNSTVSNSYSTGGVEGNVNVGGLVGSNYNQGNVLNCYSTGTVSGNEDVGGLVGDGGSFPQGRGIAMNSFWNTESSGVLESAGGLGLTTSEMHELTGYLAVGWDFVQEQANGLHEIWTMPEQGGYPTISSSIRLDPPSLAGAGTPESPYLISNATQLGAVMYYSAQAHYRLDNDIDLSGMSWSTSVIPELFGSFDGDGFEIRNLRISGARNLGFIGRLGQNAQVMNLDVVNASVSGARDNIGILVGRNEGTLDNNRCYGAVSGSAHVGGLVGDNAKGTVSNSYCRGQVSGDFHVGGLIGHHEGIVINSDSAGTVSGGSSVGGIAGYSGLGRVVNCHSTGFIRGNTPVGGLVGSNGGTVSCSYSTGHVIGDRTVGGLVGVNGGVLINSYCSAFVSGDFFIGGLVGENWQVVANSYSTGKVSGDRNTGGIAGFNRSGTVSNSFWNIESSGVLESAGGLGLTNAEMRRPTTYLDAGWDFVQERANGLHEIWTIPDPCRYPIISSSIRFEPPGLAGAGTSESPYLISTATELGAVSYYSPHAHYRLTADIDLSGISWSVAIIPGLSGTLDGNGHLVRNMMIAGGSNLGFIEKLNPGAQVTNLGIVDANVTGAKGHIGILTGLNRGTVSSSYGTGTVSGNDHVGGLVGSNEYGGAVLRCYATATVGGGGTIGGLVGLNAEGTVSKCFSSGATRGEGAVGGIAGANRDGTVSNSYSTGTVTSDGSAGGLVGYSRLGTVSNSYSTSRISGIDDVGGLIGYNKYTDTVSNCFWDIEMSGVQESARGGTGLSTAEMQDISTYLQAGWDFIDEIENGTDDIWHMVEQEYPRLVWEVESP